MFGLRSALGFLNTLTREVRGVVDALTVFSRSLCVLAGKAVFLLVEFHRISFSRFGLISMLQTAVALIATNNSPVLVPARYY